jgi:hypothetical protein
VACVYLCCMYTCCTSCSMQAQCSALQHSCTRHAWMTEAAGIRAADLAGSCAADMRPLYQGHLAFLVLCCVTHFSRSQPTAPPPSPQVYDACTCTLVSPSSGVVLPPPPPGVRCVLVCAVRGWCCGCAQPMGPHQPGLVTLQAGLQQDPRMHARLLQVRGTHRCKHDTQRQCGTNDTHTHTQPRLTCSTHTCASALQSLPLSLGLCVAYTRK